MIVRFIKKLKKAYDFMENAEAELLKEYARGVNETTMKVKTQLSGALTTISKISKDAVSTTTTLSEDFRTSIVNEERRWEDKCRLCKAEMDDDRRKLRIIQNDLMEAFNCFSEIYSKLFKHAAFVDSAHNTILTATAQVKASKDILERIHEEFKDFRKEAESLTELSVDDNYAEEGKGHNSIGVKQRIKTADA